MSGNSTNYFAHQDIETLYLRGKNIHAKNKAQRDGNTETINKNTMGETAHKLNALDNATDVGDVKIKKINSKIYQAVIKGRVAKKWDRKTLAQQINVAPKAIEELETGKAKYDIKFIQKLERKLGIKLTGKEFQ